MKNKLTDLNDILFAQLERLADEALTPDKLQDEIGRSKAIVDVAQKVIENATLQLEAVQIVHGGHGRHGVSATIDRLPRVIGLIAGNGAEAANGAVAK